MSASREMPRYRCHKEVWALKIKTVDLLGFDQGAHLTPEDPSFTSIPVSDAYCRKHHPFEGGYFIVYADGYMSFSPAKAFEEGYVAI